MEDLVVDAGSLMQLHKHNVTKVYCWGGGGEGGTWLIFLAHRDGTVSRDFFVPFFNQSWPPCNISLYSFDVARIFLVMVKEGRLNAKMSYFWVKDGSLKIKITCGNVYR